MQKQHFDVFLSHNNKDRILVHELALRLHDEADIASWLDAWHIPTGSDWEKEISHALDTCNVFAVFLGEHGWSKYHLKESLVAIERQKADSNYRIIPVLLPGTKDTDFAKGDELFARLKLLLPDAEDSDLSEVMNLFINRERVDFRVGNGINNKENFVKLVTGIIGEWKGKTRDLKVFLCHSSSDKAEIRKLYNRLNAERFDVWLDEVKLIGGQDWKTEIKKAVKNSHVVLVCLSKYSVSKVGFVQKEIKYALDIALEHPDEDIYIVPIRLEECNVPERLSRWHWIDLYEPKGYERLIKALNTRAQQIHRQKFGIDRAENKKR